MEASPRQQWSKVYHWGIQGSKRQSLSINFRFFSQFARRRSLVANEVSSSMFNLSLLKAFWASQSSQRSSSLIAGALASRIGLTNWLNEAAPINRVMNVR